LSRFVERVIAIEDAVKLMALKSRIELEEVEVGIDSAHGLVSSRRVEAPYDMPPYNRSAVDGYAVRAEDTYGASPTNPVELVVIGSIDASTPPSRVPTLRPGEAVEVATGAPIPRGANAVVMHEDVIEMGGKILVQRSVPAWGNVSRAGEDFRKGDTVVERGTVLMPWHIAALAAFGFQRVAVFRRLRVCVLATGSEVQEPREPKPPTHGVYNSTVRIVLGALSPHRFLEPRYLGLVPDEPEAVRKQLIRGVREGCDILITTRGTGVSSGDVVPRVVSEIGELVVRGLAMRPGRPTSGGVIEGRPVFMLSGFSVAALVAMEVYVLPTIFKILGAEPPPKPRVRARLTRRVANVAGYRSFVRVRVSRCGDELCAEPLRLTGSGILSTLIRGNGVLVVPEDVEGYEEGEEVEVLLLGPIYKG